MIRSMATENPVAAQRRPLNARRHLSIRPSPTTRWRYWRTSSATAESQIMVPSSIWQEAVCSRYQWTRKAGEASGGEVGDSTSQCLVCHRADYRRVENGSLRS